MSDLIPSISQLKTFRVAARCLSFKQAAGELNLTPSAVSHQIKSLEELLGTALFIRSTRDLELTEPGKEYLSLVDEVLQRLIHGTNKFINGHIQRTFTLTCLGSIAEQFILPYLALAKEKFPEVKFQIDTEIRNLDLAKENVDLAIRAGSGNWPELEVEKVIDTWIMPVCTRNYIKANPVASSSDFLNLTLIDIHDDLRGWKLWTKHQGLEDFSPPNVLVFKEPGTAIRAAEQGLGVLMAHIPLVLHQLNSRTLIAPIKKVVTSDMGVFAVYRPEQKDDEVLIYVKDLFFNVVQNYPNPPVFS
ncbi:MAG: hypothetical protein COB04_14650 [Gammaproteobacteria bacterium]|nr:MAG: hypothetical protein COB04_14650 [Gammaproteobacteria bacterium]